MSHDDLLVMEELEVVARRELEENVAALNAQRPKLTKELIDKLERDIAAARATYEEGLANLAAARAALREREEREEQERSGVFHALDGDEPGLVRCKAGCPACAAERLRSA